MRIFEIVLMFLAMMASVSSFADCEKSALAGKWSRSVTDREQVNSGKTWIWNFEGEALVATVQLTDSLTAAGFGPYFENETQFKAELAPDCTLTLKASKSIERSFRMFEEPTADISERTTDESGRVSTYQIIPMRDGNHLIVVDETNTSVMLERSR